MRVRHGCAVLGLIVFQTITTEKQHKLLGRMRIMGLLESVSPRCPARSLACSHCRPLVPPLFARSLVPFLVLAAVALVWLAVS